jgi:hypothetical protein
MTCILTAIELSHRHIQETSVANLLPKNDPLQAPELSDVGLLQNAWDVPLIIKESDNKDERTFVNPLPPLPAITLADAIWNVEEEHVSEHHDGHHHRNSHEHQHDQHYEHNQGHHQEHTNGEPEAEESSDHHPEANEAFHGQEHHVTSSFEEKNQQESAPVIVQEREYPMLNWNPSWEEPPNNNNAVDIPDLQVYSNIWDNPQPDTHVWIPPAVTDLPPPPPMIDYHHQYIHHSEVHNEQPQGTEVHMAIFPWEEQKESRPAPTRIWQDEQEIERRAREEEAWLRAEEEARIREEEERRRMEAEQAAAAEQQRYASMFVHSNDQGRQEWDGQRHDVNNQQQVIQEAWDAESGMIQQTVSERTTYHQEHTTSIDQPFVNVWDQMPSIQKYLSMIGAHDAFKKSEYQPYTKQQGEEEEEEVMAYSKEDQETAPNDEEEEDYEEEEEEAEYEDEEDEEDEEATETSAADTVPRSASPPFPTQKDRWWGEPFAIDSMPTTPHLGKLGWRSPLMPTTPRLEDADWDDRDLIPLPLKRTSRLFQPENIYQQSVTSPLKPPTEAPSSNITVMESETDSKPKKKKRRVKKPRKLFADEDDMLKRTPFASAVTTPTSEKSFLFTDVDIDADEQKDETVEPKAPDSFGEYKIEWASDLLKGTNAGIITPMARTPSREFEAGSYFEGAASSVIHKRNKYNSLASRTTWDPLHALKSLKANGEKLLISTKLGSENGDQQEGNEDSDEEYAPAAYYDNDDEEELGVLGLTFPSARPNRGFTMSKDDSPTYESMTASPATPTAKGMTMNLTDKILQEVAERRTSTDIALHEAATSLVKSTEADAQDDGYAMSPVMEEFSHKNVSATELEMSQDDLSKRRSHSLDSTHSQQSKEVDEKDKRTESSVETATATEDIDSHPVHYDIVQAATEKLRQISGVDWEAAAKEGASQDEDVTQVIFAQRYDGIPSVPLSETVTQSTSSKEPSYTSLTKPDSVAAAFETAPDDPSTGEENALEQPSKVTAIDTETDNQALSESQEEDKSAQIVTQETAEDGKVEEPIASSAQEDNEEEAIKPAVATDIGEPLSPTSQPGNVSEASNELLKPPTSDLQDTKKVIEPEITVDTDKSVARSSIPAPLSLKSENKRPETEKVHVYDDLKTPTQASFTSMSRAHDQESDSLTTSPVYSSEGESSLPDDVKKNLMDTVASLVQNVKAGDTGVPGPILETTNSLLMERETSLSNRDAQALSEDQIESYTQEPKRETNEAGMHNNVTEPGTTEPVSNRQSMMEDTYADDDMSDAQYLSATEGDRQSESGTSVDWFSVRSFNGSTDHSDNEDDQREPDTRNIHQEFLRRFGEFPELTDLSSSLTSNEEEHPVENPEADEGSVTPDATSADHTPA